MVRGPGAGEPSKASDSDRAVSRVPNRVVKYYLEHCRARGRSKGGDGGEPRAAPDTHDLGRPLFDCGHKARSTVDDLRALAA